MKPIINEPRDVGLCKDCSHFNSIVCMDGRIGICDFFTGIIDKKEVHCVGYLKKEELGDDYETLLTEDEDVAESVGTEEIGDDTPLWKVLLILIGLVLLLITAGRYGVQYLPMSMKEMLIKSHIRTICENQYGSKKIWVNKCIKLNERHIQWKK